MKLGVEQILSGKDGVNQFGISGYDWFFMELENNHLSKLDGTKRNLSIVEKYDEEAQVYIIYQLSVVNEDAANNLIKELNLDFDSLSLSDDYQKEIKKQI